MIFDIVWLLFDVYCFDFYVALPLTLRILTLFLSFQHVVMSVVKLMSRIVAPSHIDIDFEGADERKMKKAYATLHDHTYGITSGRLRTILLLMSE
mgnify:CR=1 FL=1